MIVTVLLWPFAQATFLLLPTNPAGKTMGNSARAMGKRRDMGALIGLARVPPGCSRSANSMRKASRAQAEKVAVVATCTARSCSGCTEHGLLE